MGFSQPTNENREIFSRSTKQASNRDWFSASGCRRSESLPPPSHSEGTAVSDMVVDADALADGLRAVHLAGPTRAMDEPEVRDASWIRARDRAANGDDEDFSAGTASESDWSDAELREADSKGDSDKPPSAAQGSGRPWAHVSRARAARRRERRAAADMAAAPPPPRELTESGAGVFLADLDASAAIHVLSHLSPVERARVAAVRRAERVALKSPDIVVEDDPDVADDHYYDGVVYGSSPISLSSSPALRREPRWSSGRLSMGSRTHVEGGGHLADAAWREIDLRGAATQAALCTLRGVACGKFILIIVRATRLTTSYFSLHRCHSSPGRHRVEAREARGYPRPGARVTAAAYAAMHRARG